MAKYTMELNEVINLTNIFDFKYEIYAPDKKQDLETKFINHYYFREIGVETIGRFKFKLKERWLLIIEKYNKLWRASQKEIEVYSNNSGTSSNKTEFDEMPGSPPTGIPEYVTTRTRNEGQSKSLTGMSEIEALTQYIQKLTDITTLFLKEFDSLFMQIF